MSRCGNCFQICTCLFIDSGTVDALGNGGVGSPFAADPLGIPSPRPLGYLAIEAVEIGGFAIVVPQDTHLAISFTENRLTNETANADGGMTNMSLPTRLTAPVTGNYFMGGYAHYGDNTGSAAAGRYDLRIFKNGGRATVDALVQGSRHGTNTGSEGAGISLMTMARLVAGDYIELVAFTTVATRLLDTETTSPNFFIPYLWAQWMSD